MQVGSVSTNPSKRMPKGQLINSRGNTSDSDVTYSGQRNMSYIIADKLFKYAINLECLYIGWDPNRYFSHVQWLMPT